jgi:hypothetical protein
LSIFEQFTPNALLSSTSTTLHHSDHPTEDMETEPKCGPCFSYKGNTSSIIFGYHAMF